MPVTALLNAACASKVSEGFRSIKENNLPDNCFLQDVNPFSSVNTSPMDVINSHGTTLSPTEVKEYMAVSTLVHCIDGWTYLNNSINAFLNGDLPIAIHLAYYAELRAAISFVASEGILIVNNKQICITPTDKLYIPGANQKMSLNKPQTHNATWEILKEWINNNSRSTNALEYFSYKSKSLKELINYIPYAPSSSSARLLILKKWLQKWSFDISKYSDDRKLRNNASYNPNFNRTYTPISPSERLKNINDFWKSLDPSINAFSTTDLYLLSSYLTVVYDNYVSSSSTQPISKEEFIDHFFESSGLSSDRILKTIFIENIQNVIIEHAKDNNIDQGTGNIKPLSIIARAILLLRFATGACAFLLRSNHIGKDELNFYFDTIGKDSGMWDVEQPEDFKDLWDEIYLLTEYFDDYLDEHPDSGVFNMRNDMGEFINYSPIYTQLSRASLWGLGL